MNYICDFLLRPKLDLITKKMLRISQIFYDFFYLNSSSGHSKISIIFHTFSLKISGVSTFQTDIIGNTNLFSNTDIKSMSF